MQFRLTFAGSLQPTGNMRRRDHVHEIRRYFHNQLREMWWALPTFHERPMPNGANFTEWYANQNCVGAFRFVPLLRLDMHHKCELDILFLRPGSPGDVINAGDIDNRVKTLVDALRKPDLNQIGDNLPQKGEDPFFCLMPDDRLVSSLSVETDRLWEPVNGNATDTRLVVGVTIKTYRQDLPY